LITDAGAENGGHSESRGEGGALITDTGAENGGHSESKGEGGAVVTDPGAESGGDVDSASSGQGGSEVVSGGSSGTLSTPAGGCSACAAALVHRYSFDGTGQEIVDSVGSAHGMVVNAELSGSGTVMLAGGTSDQYVDLPNGIFSSLASATLEVWVTWDGGDEWQRVLDFGASTGEEGTQNESAGCLTLIPAGPTNLRTSYHAASTDASFIVGDAPLPTGTMSHLAVVLDRVASLFYLYRDGVEVGQATLPGPPSLINDINNWLGRSQYSQDPDFNGTYHEFRIYDVALSASDIRASFEAGPDAAMPGT
jgi:hypothetical protein